MEDKQFVTFAAVYTHSGQAHTCSDGTVFVLGAEELKSAERILKELFPESLQVILRYSKGIIPRVIKGKTQIPGQGSLLSFLDFAVRLNF